MRDFEEQIPCRLVRIDGIGYFLVLDPPSSAERLISLNGSFIIFSGKQKLSNLFQEMR